jgi:3-hydroxyacyl-[acyl-carrier-protein] dehydratase
MKLLNNLFQVTESVANESSFIASIRLFPGHIVYAGHFPGHPVTPGVIQLQIVHELLERHFGKRMRLITVDNCKFLKIVNPDEQRQIQISIDYVVHHSVVHVKSAGKQDADLFFKLKATYKLANGPDGFT